MTRSIKTNKIKLIKCRNVRLIFKYDVTIWIFQIRHRVEASKINKTANVVGAFNNTKGSLCHINRHAN